MRAACCPPGPKPRQTCGASGGFDSRRGDLEDTEMMPRVVWRFRLPHWGANKIDIGRPSEFQKVLGPIVGPALEKLELHAVLVRLQKYQRLPWGPEKCLRGTHQVALGRCERCMEDAREVALRRLAYRERQLHNGTWIWAGTAQLLVPVQVHVPSPQLLEARKQLWDIMGTKTTMTSAAWAVLENPRAVRCLPHHASGQLYALMLELEISSRVLGDGSINTDLAFGSLGAAALNVRDNLRRWIEEADPGSL